MADHEVRACDAAMVRAFEILGKRWNGMIVSVLATDPAAFSELTGAGIVERSVQPGPPVSVSYGLTDSGRALVPALDLLAGWARDRLDPRAPAGA